MIAVGEIEKFMMNRDGNIKGFRLTDGTVVITPPREGENLFAQLKHGDEVHVTGYQFVTSHGKSRIIANQIEIQHNRNANERYHESRHPSDDVPRTNTKSESAEDLDNWIDLNRVANSILSELRVLNRELKTLISG